jgi:hypothetical protein
MNAKDPQMTSCPADEVLAAFTELRLHGTERERVEEHIAACTTCLDVVAATLPPAPEPATGEIPVRARPVSSGRRWRRWAVAASLALVAGGLVFAARQQSVLDRLGPSVARLMSRWLGPGMQAETIAVRLGATPGSFEVTLGSVRIGRDLDMFLRADQIGITVALAALLLREPVVGEIRLLSPTLQLTESPSLKLAWPKTDRARVSAVLAQAKRIAVDDARLVVRGPGGRSFVVEHLSGGIEHTAEGAKLALQGRANGGAIDVLGTIGDADQHVALTIAGRDLDAATLPILGRGVTGGADFRLDLTSSGDAIRADGRIALRKGRVVGRGPTRLFPMNRDTMAALASVEPGFAESDLMFDEARAVFAWRHGTWRVPRLFLSNGTTIVGGRARVGADGSVSGHGTIRLPPDVVAGLEANDPRLAEFRDPSGAATVPFGVAGSTETPRFTLGHP